MSDTAPKLTEEREPADALLLDALEPIPGLKDRLEAVDLRTPLVGSHYSVDRCLSYGGDRPGLTTLNRLSIAMDHLLTWYRIIFEAQFIPVHAHVTLLRPAIEASVQARWLLDATVSPCDRVGRALGLALDDLNERRKIEDDWSKDPGYHQVGQTALQRADQLRDQAKAADIEPQYRDTIALLRLYPLHEYATDLAVFRFICGVVHGTIWASIHGQIETVEAGATVSTYKQTSDQAEAGMLTQAAVAQFAAALTVLEAYVEPSPRHQDGQI